MKSATLKFALAFSLLLLWRSAYAQKVGINTETPFTALDVNGAISSRQFLHYATNDTVDIPLEYNLAIIYGGGWDTITAILPAPPLGLTGQRLIVKNKADALIIVPLLYNSVTILQNQSVEFLYSSYDDWSFIGTSEVTVEGNFWKIYGNLGTNPFYHAIGTVDSVGLTLKTNNVPRVQISAGGNVGIGDLYQTDQLLRAKSTKLNTTGYFLNTEAEFGDNGHSYSVYGLNMSNTNGSNYGGFFNSNGYSQYTNGSNIGVAAFAENGQNQSIGLLARGTTLAAHFDVGKVLIDERLGIGKTPSSTTRLDVLMQQYENIAARFVFPLDGDDNEVSIGKKLGTDFMGLYIDVENTYDSIAIWAKGKAFILNDLSVGGAIAPPGYTMAVDGKIIAEEVRVQNSLDWPDYVFQKDYFLRPIEEVASFVENHSHLPGVPSAKQVSEEGILLGEMQAILLQKVEELTLYIIDQQKELEKVKAELALIKAAKQ